MSRIGCAVASVRNARLRGSEAAKCVTRMGSAVA